MSHHQIHEGGQEEQCLLTQMKQWVNSLTIQQLQEAMIFPFQDYDNPSSSSSSSSSSTTSSTTSSSSPDSIPITSSSPATTITSSNENCHEYELLLEMLSNQSPPPTPIHPRALGYPCKYHASNKPITNGRWDEEERVLRDRLERPRLFQFMERRVQKQHQQRNQQRNQQRHQQRHQQWQGKQSIPNHDFDNDNGDFDIMKIGGLELAGLGLPSEIAALVQQEQKEQRRKNARAKAKAKSKTKTKTVQMNDKVTKIDASTSNDKHKIKNKKRKNLHFDIITKKFISPYGDMYSLGCTNEQREADVDILIGTRIQYSYDYSVANSKIASSTKTSTSISTTTKGTTHVNINQNNNKSNSNGNGNNHYNCYYGKFHPNIQLYIGGKMKVMKKMEQASDIIRMLHVVSRGRFLSSPFTSSLSQSSLSSSSSSSINCSPNDRIPFCAPWFDPTKEWFSLSVYLASRFEVALWNSFFQSKCSGNDSVGTSTTSTITIGSRIGRIQPTTIEQRYTSMSKEIFYQCLLQSIRQTLQKFLLVEIKEQHDMGREEKILDLCLHKLLLSSNSHFGFSNSNNNNNSNNVSGVGSLESLLDEQIFNNYDIIQALISTQLVHLGSSKDIFRLKLIQNLEEVLSEEVGRSLIKSCAIGSEVIHSSGKMMKQTKRKKKKNKRKQMNSSSQNMNQLKSIDEHKDDETAKEATKCSEDHQSLVPLQNVNFIGTKSNVNMKRDAFFILEIVDGIFSETFQKLGFESDDDNKDGFSSKVTCHEVPEMKRDGKQYILKKIWKPKKDKETSDHGTPPKEESHIMFSPMDELIHDNQMTMKRSNLSSSWDRAVSQPVFSNERYMHDFFRSHPLEMPQLTESIFDQQHPQQFKFHDQQQFRDHKHDGNNEEELATSQNNFCLDSAFVRMGKSLMDDLLDTVQKVGDENFASSTAASIASSILDFDNEQKPHDISSNEIISEEEAYISDTHVVNIEENDSLQELIADSGYVSFDEAPLNDEQLSKVSSSQEEPNVIAHRINGEENIASPKNSQIRKNTQKERKDKINIEGNLASPVLFSSMPSSPKIPTRSWSREDLRISFAKDDSHDFRRNTSVQTYRNAALKGSRRTPSISSHDIQASSKRRMEIESIQFVRSASSLKPSTKEVIIDGAIHLNVCAQSESALDNHEDSSHWNVIPKLELDETDNATKDGATTISSMPSAPETEEINCLREERNAYRDMCLTLGSEIAKLKNLLAIEESNSSFVYMPSHVSSFDYVSAPQSCDPEHMPSFYQNRYRGIGNKFMAKSDAGVHNDTQMSEDGTEFIHSSVAATDASGKHRTVNSSSIGNMKLSSLSGERRTESDVASLEHDTGFSVFNPPTSTCFFVRESFGPAHLHGLQSRLGRDINLFVSSVAIQLEKRSSKRELARKRLTTLVTTIWPRAQVKIYGSHVTGLCLPSSDLDFVICLPAVHQNTLADTPGALEGRNAINESNEKLLARKLKSESWIDTRSIKIIERTVVPVIKVATKDTRSKSLQLDISFDSPRHHGLDAIEMVTDTMSRYPMVRPLVLVLKQFLLDKGLLTAYTGGLSSYCVFLMITRYLQEHPLGWADTGVFLMGFLDFYGNHFDPRSTGISVEKKQYFPRPHYAQQTDNSSDNSSENWKTHSNIGMDRRHSFQSDNDVSGKSVTRRNQPSSGHQYYNQRTNSSGQNYVAANRPFTFDPLFVEDPISRGNNVGRNSFRISKIQRTFSDAHRALVARLEWDMNSDAEIEGGCQLLKCLINSEDNSY